MRRMAASKFGKSQPESDRGGQSLAPTRRRGSHPSQRIGRPPRGRSRLRFRPLPLRPQSGDLIQARAATQVKGAWEVVDDFPGEITVLPRELRVIETYLAGVVDEFLEPRRLEIGHSVGETAKRNVVEE
jgi:hypothetical protein